MVAKRGLEKILYGGKAYFAEQFKNESGFDLDITAACGPRNSAVTATVQVTPGQTGHYIRAHNGDSAKDGHQHHYGVTATKAGLPVCRRGGVS